MNKENSLSNGLKKEISSLYEIMRNEKLEELEIEEKDFYVHLKRKGKEPVRMAAQVYNAPAVQEPVSQVAEAVQIAGDTIKSPIMGVFYRSPSPTHASFVKEGDMANPGKTVCIVEAMKVMNEIKMDFKAKIVKILVENGSPVTADQGFVRHRKGLIMQDIIGNTAGDIWKYLIEKQTATVMEIKSQLGISNTLLHLALGWLLRENKITISQYGHTYKVELIG